MCIRGFSRFLRTDSILKCEEYLFVSCLRSTQEYLAHMETVWLMIFDLSINRIYLRYSLRNFYCTKFDFSSWKRSTFKVFRRNWADNISNTSKSRIVYDSVIQIILFLGCSTVSWQKSSRLPGIYNFPRILGTPFFLTDIWQDVLQQI